MALAFALRLLKAEAAARLDRIDEAGQLIHEAAALHEEPTLEQFAELERVTGIGCACAGDHERARSHFARATRLLTTAGHLTARREVVEQFQDLCRASLGAAVRPAGSTEETIPAHLVLPAAPESPARHLERAASIVDLGAYPTLVGHELSRLLRDAGALTEAAVVVGAAPKRTAVDSVGCTDERARVLASIRKPGYRFALGTWRDQPVELVGTPTPGVSARTTFAAAERLARGAAWYQAARRAERERTALWPIDSIEDLDREVIVSQIMVEMVQTAKRIGPTPLPVLITGETGTGKEVLARIIHRASSRADKPFVPFNCTAVARDMVDSQLFGYRRGAFTGAVNDFPGVIRAAGGGTLLLDEIAEIGPDVQPKLLRFLESGEIHPLGEARPVKVDVRVIALTNANIEQMVRDGRFREDLYYRLNVIRFHLPPLRERREEIPPLIDFYLRKHGDELQKRDLRVADETLEYLLLHRWPGNVRQLANELRRVVALAENGAVLMPEHLADEITAGRRTVPTGVRPPMPNEVNVRLDQPLPAILEHVERSAVRFALNSSNGRVDEAARRLGLSRKGLYLKRQRLGIRPPVPAK